MTEPSLPEESIFAQALEIGSSVERAAFLDRACGQDPALRAEVEALLGAHERAGGLLDLPDKPGVRGQESGVSKKGADEGHLTPDSCLLTPEMDEQITERPGTIIGP